MNENMKSDLEKLITVNQERYKAAELLSRTYHDVNHKIFSASFKEVVEVWNMQFNEKFSLHFFTFSGYDFYLKPSIEQGYLHFDIYPEKPERKDHFRQAKEPGVDPIYRYFTALQHSQEFKVSLQNQNYVAWIPSQYSPESLDFEERVKLLDDKGKHRWAEDIIKEAKELMIFIHEDLEKKNELKVIFNEEILEMLTNF